MDDLSAMISSVLNDPQKLRQIQDMAQSLGLGGDQPAPLPEHREQGSGYSTPQQNGGPDLSSLLGMLGNTAGQNIQQPVQQQAGTPDLSSLLGMLGGNSGQSAQPPIPQQANTPDLSALLGMLGGNPGQGAQQSIPQQTSTPDLSALLGMLGNSLGQGSQQPAGQQAGTPDLSSLLGMLGGNPGQYQQQAPPPPPQNGFNISALTNMLGGPAQGAAAPASPINMDVIMKLGQAMASMQSNRQSIDFLLSLKPKLNEKRSKKVDDAIKVMQLIQFLPLIQESGLFSGLDSILGGLGGSGLNNLLGGLTGGSGGLGGLLNGILGRPA